MRKSSKLLMVPIAAAAAALLLAGCTSPASQGGSASEKSHLAQVLDSKKLRVAMIPDNPPSSTLTSSGEWKGYDVDIAVKLAEALGAELEFLSTDGDNRLTMVQTDKADVAISTFTPNNERAKSIDFTIPYTSSGSLPLFLADSGIKSFRDLAGKSVSVARGGSADTLFTARYPDTEVVRFDSIADAFLALKTGKVEALIEDNPIVHELIKENPGFATITGSPENMGYIAMGIQQGDQVWLNYLNNFINNMNVSGDNNEMYVKWFGIDMPKLYDY